MIALKYLSIVVLTSTLLMACSGEHKEENHNHHTHRGIVQIAAYGEHIEVFAEVSALSIGKESQILAHFTNLSDFKPIGKSASVKLTVGSKSVTVTSNHPERPGIFMFKLTPSAVGEAVLEFTVNSGEESYSATAEGLRVFENEHKAAHVADENEIKSSNATVFSKEMAWKSNFATAPVEYREMGEVIRTMGIVEALQGETRTISARNSGTVTYVKGETTIGMSVSAGQGLFRIDATQTVDNNLKVQLRELKSEFETALKELEREEELFKDRLTTAAEVNAARNAYESARARYEHLNGSFGAGGSTASSPISGYIINIDVQNGQHVEAGQALATVSQTRDVVIRAEVAPSYYPILSQISDATFHRPNSDHVWTLSELNGQVLSYGKSLANGNPLVPISFKVRNIADFIPGTYVDIYISTESRTPVLCVPSGAIIEEMGAKFVFVQLTPELFEKRQVETGASDGRYTAVTGDITIGDRVVSKGAVLVKLSHSTGALDPHAGHVH